MNFVVLFCFNALVSAAAIVPEHYIRLNDTSAAVEPHWPHIYLDGKSGYAYANPQGLALLDARHIAYTAATRLSRPKQLSELFDWNCTEPRFCRTFSIGNSVRGHPIKGARLTDFKTLSHRHRAQFVYIGNIHGDETVGRYVLARLIEDLQHKRNSNFLQHLDIYIIPSVNPDGFLLGRRTNANGYDLNRNFPDQFGWETHPRQLETQHIMNFMHTHNFSMGANLHGGDIVANYGFDGNKERRSGQYCAAPDDRTLSYISSVYARQHERMMKSREFPGGITNGCHWYVLYGGLQDWAYLNRTQYHITLELSYVKDPMRLQPYWPENRDALYAYMRHAFAF